jgi:hypothetical protein
LARTPILLFSPEPEKANEANDKIAAQNKPWKCRVWKAWKAIKPAFHPSHTPWKSLRGFPHSHGYGDDYH